MFIISDFTCSPEEVTRILGVTPSRFWIAGEKVGDGAPKKRNGWALENSIRGDWDMEAELRPLLDRLPKSLSALRETTSQWSAKAFCAVYTHGERPALSLSAGTVARLAELEAEIDIDLYVVE